MKVVNFIVIVIAFTIIQFVPKTFVFYDSLKMLFVGAQIMALINYLYLSKTED